MSNLLPLLFLSLMFYACADSIQLSKQQQQGKKIFESLCDKCHKLIAPSKHTDAEWVKAVNFYGTKLKLQKSDKDAVSAYLTFVNDN